VRLTIERLRTLVLAAALLLLVALVGFLAFGKWKRHFISHDLPQKLGINIQQESDGVTFSHALGAHSQFKIHASKVVQLKQGNAQLHNVRIELYGEDGSRVDRIEGDEFEYDEKSGTAVAAGPVAITLMRPGTAPSIAPKAAPSQAMDKQNPLSAAARAASAGEVHIKTSGLTFNWKTGEATTAKRVDFNTTQGAGSAIGSTYDSKEGHLVLDHAVELRSERNGNPIELTAAHAEFEHGDMICHLRSATASYRGGQATAAEAQVEFRDDGTATHLEATGGFQLVTSSGGKIEAPRGALEFNDHNQPRHGRLSDGVKMDSVTAGRRTHGSAPSADLEFTAQGELRHAHLERGVAMESEESNQTAGAHPETVRNSRTWRSPVAEIEFRNAGHGHMEPATLLGTGGVEVTSQSQRGQAAPTQARMHADQISGQFGAGASLSGLTGTGHASMEQTTTGGARQTATGERIQARFADVRPTEIRSSGSHTDPARSRNQIQSAVVEQNVVFVQQAAAKAGTAPQPPLRATAGRAEYAGDGQWLHLTTNPRIDQGGMQLTADRIDLSEDSGDAFAHGNVKATWTPTGKPGQNAPALGGSDEPAHAVSAEAQLHQTPGSNQSLATFRGHARLWQQSNSVTAPVIVLDRQQQTLEAHSTDHAEPVRVVMLNAQGRPAGKTGPASPKNSPTTPSVIRVHGADLHYSDLNRSALMQGGALGPVVAETGSATTQSSQVELDLATAGKGSAHTGGSGQVERMIARGHVAINSEDRRGSGEQIVFTGATGEYVLTGTSNAQPRLTDPERGSVSGEALIFRSRDDSVSIEGRGHPTTTTTNAPR
jgi:lipopolysaccharide export system protein LptA